MNYAAKVTVIGEGGTRPFKLSDALDVKNDAEAKIKACAWYERERPDLYKPVELLLQHGDREVKRWPLPQ